MKGKILYEETQTFRNTWIWYLMMIISFGATALICRAIIIQILSREPWGYDPTSDSNLILFSIAKILFSIGIFMFIHFHKLIIQVDEGTFRYKYIPYFSRFREVSKHHVKDLCIRKYNSIWEGWGYRIRPGRKALNIAGSWGLQINFKNKKSKLLIGTQKPKELSTAIDQLKANWAMN